MTQEPPWSEEAERAVLSAMLLNRQARDEVLDADLDAGDFWSPRHAAVFAALLELHHRGATVDPVQVIEEMRAQGTLDQMRGRETLRTVQRSQGVSASARRYVTIVAEHAVARRTIGLADDLRTAGYESDLAKIQGLLDGAAETLDAPVEQVRATEASILASGSELHHRPWAVHGLLRVRDRLGLSGPEGHGKMSILRQLAVCAASGLTPFTLEGVDPVPALIVDLQEDEDELGDQLRWILGYAGTAYRGDGLYAVSRTQGMNLLSRADRRWLEGLIRAHRPALLVLGPLRKTYRAPERFGKSSEEAADELTRILDDLRVGYDVAVAIEGHAGHDRETWRFRGSSVWLDWFNFGFGLDPVKSSEKAQRERRTRLKRWRGDRPPGRPWPHTLVAGQSMPWEDADQPPLGGSAPELM